MYNKAKMPHTINNITYGNTTTNSVKKLSQVPLLVPHVYRGMNTRPTRYGSFIATITNEDSGEEYEVYMPKYIADRALPGRRFIYCGLEKKSDGSGHSYHNVGWQQE